MNWAPEKGIDWIDFFFCFKPFGMGLPQIRIFVGTAGSWDDAVPLRSALLARGKRSPSTWGKPPIGHWGHCSKSYRKPGNHTKPMGHRDAWKVVTVVPSLRFDVPTAVWCHCPQHPAGYSAGPCVPCRGSLKKWSTNINKNPGGLNRLCWASEALQPFPPMGQSSMPCVVIFPHYPAISIDLVKLWVQDISGIVSSKAAWVPDVTSHPVGRTMSPEWQKLPFTAMLTSVARSICREFSATLLCAARCTWISRKSSLGLSLHKALQHQLESKWSNDPFRNIRSPTKSVPSAPHLGHVGVYIRIYIIWIVCSEYIHIYATTCILHYR